MTMHMMKERAKGVETAKCGVQEQSRKDKAPMTIWYTMVDCPECLEAMGMFRTASGKVLTEADIDTFVEEAERGYSVADLAKNQIAPPRKRVIPRQP